MERTFVKVFDNIKVVATVRVPDKSGTFSVTFVESEKRRNGWREMFCGPASVTHRWHAMFPELHDVLALHLCNKVGAPSYVVADGYYWLAGVMGGLGERYHGGRHKSRDECVEYLARHLRISVQECTELVSMMKTFEASAVRPQFSAYVLAQYPRWKVEADAVIAKYSK